ncbi:MAG TPA: serine hydrolase [Solirubrobacteraceae bacterium]
MSTDTATRLRSAGGRVWRVGGVVLSVVLAAGVASGAWADRTAAAGPAGDAGATITAAASPAELAFGSTTSVSGALTGPTGIGEAGVEVALERSAYPYAGYASIEHATTQPDGSYAFGGLIPDRDTRYEVEEAGDPSVVSQPVGVVLDTPVVTRVTTSADGELRVTATAEHSRAFDWNDRRARWYVSTNGGRTSKLVAQTTTREVRAGETRVSASFYPPTGPLSYRVCFTAGGTRGLGRGTTSHRCEVSGTWIGNPSPAVPSSGEISSAEEFLDGRAGRTGFAVLDSHGRLSGVRMHERFDSASLIKAMLLVADLRRIGDAHRRLSEEDREILEPMIHVSDNDAASAVFAIVGESGLVSLASAAGMTDFSPNASWGLSKISPADQARFFADQDSLIPPEFVDYARSLLSGIDPSQRWGIPAGVDGRYDVFFKGGWLPDMGVVNQAARLEGHGETIGVSILTSGGPGMAYGEQTLEETTERLLD